VIHNAVFRPVASFYAMAHILSLPSALRKSSPSLNTLWRQLIELKAHIFDQRLTPSNDAVALLQFWCVYECHDLRVLTYL